MNERNGVKERISFLEERIMSASQKYYSDGSSPYSDYEWDLMVKELESICPESPVLRKTGWGYDVFKDPTPGEKYAHKYGEAGSLKKAYTLKEMDKDFKEPSQIALGSSMQLSLKLDGLSVVLYYHKGKLFRALTRGDGTTGIDITQKIEVIMGTDRLRTDTQFCGAVRGEILMDEACWEDFKKLSPEAKNSRNSTAGLINMDRLAPHLLKYLKVVVYTVVGDESLKLKETEYPDPRLDLHHWEFWLMQNFEFVVPSLEVVFPNSVDTVRAYRDILNSKWKYPIDGVVFKRYDLEFSADTGEIRYIAQAFKFESEKEDSTVEEVIWNLTKTRYLMPKVRIRPVQLAGTTVQYCTGYNAKYIKDNNIGPGAVVEVEKHGEIIPNINTVVKSGECDIPTVCPCCNTKLEWNGVHLQCPNELCGNASEQDLLVWIENLAPVDNFGSLLQMKFLKERLGDAISIESIMQNKPLMKYMSPFAGKGAQFKLFQDMIKKLYEGRYSLEDAIRALNIPRFGDVTAKKLADHPDLVLKILDVLVHDEEVIFDCVTELVPYMYNNIGEANTDSLIANLYKLKRLNLIRDRIEWSAPVKGVVSYVKVAVTGKLSVPRSAFEKELSEHGYIIADVSKDTRFLITDDPNSNSSKNQKADKLGVTKITEHEFRKEYMS